jgi:hypothetical protein
MINDVVYRIHWMMVAHIDHWHLIKEPLGMRGFKERAAGAVGKESVVEPS